MRRSEETYFVLLWRSSCRKTWRTCHVIPILGDANSSWHRGKTTRRTSNYLKLNDDFALDRCTVAGLEESASPRVGIRSARRRNGRACCAISIACSWSASAIGVMTGRFAPTSRSRLPVYFATLTSRCRGAPNRCRHRKLVPLKKSVPKRRGRSRPGATSSPISPKVA